MSRESFKLDSERCNQTQRIRKLEKTVNYLYLVVKEVSTLTWSVEAENEAAWRSPYIFHAPL